jgi:predicted RNA binding protein YcfA (HicA-like mRNA interferase family)
MALRDTRRQLFELVKKNGFVLQRETKHYVFKHKTLGKILVCSKSTRDRRSLRNVERDIKRLLSS